MARSAEIFQRWIDEVWSAARVSDDLVADDFVGHWPDRDVRGRDELAAIVRTTREMFDELTFQIELGPLRDGDYVVGRWTGVGRLQTGETRFTGNDILRLDGERIAEYWTGTSTAA
jgi:hypothetical protein